MSSIVKSAGSAAFAVLGLAVVLGAIFLVAGLFGLAGQAVAGELGMKVAFFLGLAFAVFTACDYFGV